MNHSFDIEVAEKYGMLEAVLLNHISFWIAKNKANNENYFDGYYWTYNTIKAFAELFPYASEKQIRRALKHLIDEGILITGNYNKLAYDRTLWYALTAEGNRISQEEKSILPNEKIDLPKWENGVSQEGKAIPDINTDINTDINAVVVVQPRPQEQPEQAETVIKTIPQPSMSDYDGIMALWNQQECTQKIREIDPLTRREDNTRILLHKYGLNEFLDAIRSIDEQEYFQLEAGKRNLVSYDWFVDINNFIKVLEGNYRYEHREETFLEKLERMGDG